MDKETYEGKLNRPAQWHKRNRVISYDRLEKDLADMRMIIGAQKIYIETLENIISKETRGEGA
jgi:hypothetical protein